MNILFNIYIITNVNDNITLWVNYFEAKTISKYTIISYRYVSFPQY